VVPNTYANKCNKNEAPDKTNTKTNMYPNTCTNNVVLDTYANKCDKNKAPDKTNTNTNTYPSSCTNNMVPDTSPNTSANLSCDASSISVNVGV
jgi:hypothetical protein